MKLHRFYIEQEVGEEPEITLTDTELIHQLVNVFRFTIDDKVVLFDGSGFEYECEIILINKNKVDLKIINKKSKFADGARDKNVSLYLSLIKKNNFELAVEKCTEIGVTEIHPIISERSEKKDLNIARLNKIAKEAGEQSGRVTLPQIFDIVSLAEAVSQAVKDNQLCLAFHTGESNCNSSVIGEDNRPDSHHLPLPTREPFLEKDERSLTPTAVFVGPEGGFTEKEIELFKQNNFEILSLGSNILRAETAAIVAVWDVLRSQY